jgi:hypothetical protein
LNLIDGMICADMDGGRQHTDNVEVVFPESNVIGAQASSAADSTSPAMALSAAANSLTLAEKAIAALPPALGAQASDPRERLGHRTWDGSSVGGLIRQRTLYNAYFV